MSAAAGSDRPGLVRPLMASLVIVGLWLAVVWVGTTITQAVRPPPCLGIGAECSLSASAATVAAAVFAGLPALLIAWVATLIGWAVSGRVTSQTSRRWLVWGAPTVLAVLAVVQVVGSTIGTLLG